MKLTRFLKDGFPAFGIVTAAGVIDVQAVGVEMSMVRAMEDWPAAKQLLEPLTRDGTLPTIDPDALLWAPLTQPTKIICVGLNYKDHAEETHSQLPEYPMIFSKMPESLTVSGAPVAIPQRETKIDHEAELVTVVGRTAHQISEENAANYIFGYTCGNDISDREAQFVTSQHLIGKGCPGFAPVGPYLVTADDIDPIGLSIRCTVNGVVRQSSDTSRMIFSPGQILSYVSRYIRLNPGDLIFTGTPNGVIMGNPPKKRQWLTVGDEMTVEIENIGVLRTTLV